MRVIALLAVVALAVVAVTTAACDFSPAGSDPSRPSLFPGAAPTGGPTPADPVAIQPSPLADAPAGASDATMTLWMTSPPGASRYPVLQPYPSQQQVLDRQRLMLSQDVRGQETGRDALGQQLQQGVQRDQQDAQRLQQQIEQDRRR